MKKEYETVWEIFNECANNQMRDVFFDEIETDDGCRLYIDDKMVIDSWKNRGLTTDSVVVTLEKDKKYRLVAEYFDNACGTS